MRATLASAAFALVLAAAAPASGPARAAEPVDLLFDTAHLETAEPGAVLRYAHTRSSDPALGIGPDLDQTITIDVGEGRASRFTMDADGRPRSFDVSDGIPGNPLLAVFLEQSLRAAAKATGGSPFYLRNRMREALGERLTAVEPDAVFSMRPFAGDDNARKLGAFEDLEMVFELSPDAPGMLVAMRAVAGPEDAPVYREEIRLDAQP